MKKLIDFLISLFVGGKTDIVTLAPPRPTKSSRSIKDANVLLKMAWPEIRKRYQKAHPGLTLIITQSHRTVKRQQKLYAKGRTKPGKKVTWVDGVKRIGKHNYYPSQAIDVAVKSLFMNKITWNVVLYKPLVKIVKEVGKEMDIKLVSGGTWKKKDYPHIQV